MGRGTAWWRAVCRGAVAVAVLGAGAVFGAGVPSAVAAGTPTPYGFSPDATTVSGVAGTADAAPLEPGRTYRSSLPVNEDVYYGLELDATSNAYVAVTAVPPADADLSASDGIRVSVQDADGRSCNSETENFGGGSSARPITAVALRELSTARTRCAQAGAYYVVVERVGTTTAADSFWDLELATFSEPPRAGSASTEAPGTWNSESPEPVTGEAVRRDGGAGFASAVSVDHGVWRSDLTPGQTVFYKVPVGWGQQVYASAELAGTAEGSRIVVGALELSLHNPVRAPLDDVNLNYDGSRRSTSLEPLPPVAYENRYGNSDQIKGMRFGGSYYLVAHLSAQMAERFGDGPFAMTLRVRVEGSGELGPAYDGRFTPQGVFAPVVGVGESSGAGTSGDGSEKDETAMTIVAVGGIGGGTVILAVLGVWTAAGRRRVSSS
ncbi:hypothetical protein BN159_4509 [Streptomyces davaonensis JCM 4913]|uniref:Uncharacterized protein n=2 Tax=Streptomyces davaonensis TaxID=348043 RepID=K4R6C8_STRDJ|nr:hypothetical protein BN159_4509 [Streptomyces davaonensis JCM 4913]